MNATGRVYVTPAVVKGAQLIRVSIGATGTERADVEAVWAELQQAGRTLLEQKPRAKTGRTA